MAQKQRQEDELSSQVQEAFAQLEGLRAERQTVDPKLYDNIATVEGAFSHLEKESVDTLEQKTGEAKQASTQIQAEIKKMSADGVLLAKIAQGLALQIDGYVDFIDQANQFRGVEYALHLLPSVKAKEKAKSLRDIRLSKMRPADTLKVVLSYGEQVVKELLNRKNENQVGYDRLQQTVDMQTDKIRIFGPLEMEINERLGAMEAAYKELEAKYNAASQAEQIKFQTEKNAMHSQLSQLRREHDRVLVIYKEAQETIESNQKSRDAAEQTVRSLGLLADKIHQKMENVVRQYEYAPVITKTMLSVRGTELIDQALNAAGAKTLDMITGAAKAISDTQLRRDETPYIPPDEMRVYVQRVLDMKTDFEQRHGQTRDESHQSRDQRYKIEKT